MFSLFCSISGEYRDEGLVGFLDERGRRPEQTEQPEASSGVSSAMIFFSKMVRLVTKQTAFISAGTARSQAK
jgi:hypothetical protein